MFHRWAALVLVLALWTSLPKHAAGQTKAQEPPRGHSAGTLGKPYPNPTNPESLIDFQVEADSCADRSKQHAVTLRVLNILGMPIAHYNLQGLVADSAAAVDSSSTNGMTLSDAKLGCGTYRARWDGKLPNGKSAPSGAYVIQLLVDKTLAGTQKIYLGK